MNPGTDYTNRKLNLFALLAASTIQANCSWYKCPRAADSLWHACDAVANGQNGRAPQSTAKLQEFVFKPLFSCLQNFKILQDFPSHRIFECMHEVLNVVK